MQVNNLSKTKKWTVGILAIVTVGAAIGGYTVYAESKNKAAIESAQKEINQDTKELKKIGEKTHALFDKKHPVFLVENVEGATLTSIEKEVNNLTKKHTNFTVDKKKLELSDFDKQATSIKKKLNQANEKLAAQEAVNTLFTPKDKKSAMNGIAIQKELAIVDNLTAKKVETVKKDHFVNESTNTFQKTVNELIVSAEAQVKQIETARQAVAKIYKDNKVLSTDPQLYDAAKAAADKVKNEQVKKELVAMTGKVKVEMDKKVAEKNQQEAAQAQSNQAQATDQPIAPQVATNDNQAVAANDSYDTGNGATGTGGGGYDYQAPTNTNNGGGSPAPAPQAPSSGGNGQGILTQDQMNQAAEEASKSDPTQDPNSPWYNK